MTNQAMITGIGIAMLFYFMFMIALYVFGCYVLYRIGRKFNVGTFGLYLIPVYNIILLLRCIQANELYVLGFFIPFVNIALTVYLFGNLARRLGKDFWLYGILSLLFGGIPLLVLAFDNSIPVNNTNFEFAATPQLPNQPAANNYNPAGATPPPPPNYLPETNQGINSTPSYSPPGSSIVLSFLTGEYSGNQIDLPDTGIIIGRDPQQAGLIVSSPEISRAHLRIMPDHNEPDSILLEDLSSANGTFIQRSNSLTSDYWEKITIMRMPISQINKVMLAEHVIEFAIVCKN